MLRRIMGFRVLAPICIGPGICRQSMPIMADDKALNVYIVLPLAGN